MLPALRPASRVSVLFCTLCPFDQFSCLGSLESPGLSLRPGSVAAHIVPASLPVLPKWPLPLCHTLLPHPPSRSARSISPIHPPNAVYILCEWRMAGRGVWARRAILDGDSCVVFFGARRVGNGLFLHGKWPLGDGQWIVSARAMTPFGRGTGCSAGGQRALDFLWSDAETLLTENFSVVRRFPGTL